MLYSEFIKKYPTLPHGTVVIQINDDIRTPIIISRNQTNKEFEITFLTGLTYSNESAINILNRVLSGKYEISKFKEYCWGL